MDPFQHVALDRSKECIRLLRFIDQPPSSELDHFTLETYDIETAPRFVALSYTWGSPEPTHGIIVNGSLLSIRENLRMALKVLRSFFPNKASFLDKPWRWVDTGMTPSEDVSQRNTYPLMWIDAICIDQSNPLEKSHQVNMMERIFTMARCVISWLGDEADNSRCVMRAIRGTTYILQYAFEVKQAMVAFLKRPYWRRIWVIQEFALPQDLIILCGHEGAWWEDLFHFWHDEKLLGGTDEGYRNSQCRRDGFFDHSTGGAGDARAARHISISVERIMTRFTFGQCSDPRDRIYALLGLIKPKAGVGPLLAGYEISAEDLYYRLLGYVRPLKRARNWMRFRQKLREVLDSSSWAGAEAAKLHEVVYEIVGMEYALEWSGEVAFTKEERGLSIRVQECLAKPMGQRFDDIFRDGDWIYHDIVQCFQAFPRGEEPGTWRRFNSLLLRWLQILPASDDSLFRNDMSAGELELSA